MDATRIIPGIGGGEETCLSSVSTHTNSMVLVLFSFKLLF